MEQIESPALQLRPARLTYK